MDILILQLVVLILDLVTGNISIPSLLSPINEVISFFPFNNVQFYLWKVGRDEPFIVKCIFFT
ncbi:MAG TPA: hypothetical protein DDY40_04330 [Barnesiella intestinihominis]|nr:hypothetical protein [Barnesiella intestinihominis]HCP44281.1 hypothetical protein [Barnesiella intestinihominis]